jgi:sporulation protein YlmC with PRC-barrel domain
MTSSPHTNSPTINHPDPLRVDFHLLDRQIIDSAGQPVGKVDDVELATDPNTGALQVRALLSGQRVLGERIGGRLGQFLAATARRLSPVEDPPPLRIDLDQVTDIGSAITLSIRRELLLTPPLAKWLTEHVIDKIPGAGHAGK